MVKKTTQKEYAKIVTRYQNSGLTPIAFINSIKNPNSQRKAVNALKNAGILQPTAKKAVKTKTKKAVPSASIKGSGKVTQIPTQTQQMKVFSKNFTIDFKIPITLQQFRIKIPYLVSRIISSFNSFNFTTKTLSNIISNTIFIDKYNSQINLPHNSSNQTAHTQQALHQNIYNFLILLSHTAFTSNLKIAFIDLTVRLYQF